MSFRISLSLIILYWGWQVSSASADPATDEAFFESKIRPILASSCARCHNEQKISGGLRLDSKEALEKGGESGPAFVVGDADKSLIVQAVRRLEDVSAMPPDKAISPLEVEAMAEWVRRGAYWPEKAAHIEASRHWAFEPVVTHEPEAVRDAEWSQSAIDQYILAKLEQAERKPSPRADRRTLIRRASYDLIGLPPSYEEVRAFEEDSSPDAFEKVIDRLLCSPAYGEQWGRHWLDVVRYADTAGENTDRPLPHAWRYRNWVIQSLNEDKPYDAFVSEQIAGDLIARDGEPSAYADRVVATGFLAISRRFGHFIDKDIHLTYEDSLDTMGKAFLGLSIGCCRCHDHKYDPLSARDYYGLYGVLASTRLSFPGSEPESLPRDLVPIIPPSQIKEMMQPFDAESAKLDEEMKSWADKESVLAKSMESSASTPPVTLATGSIDDAQSSSIYPASSAPATNVSVKKGEIIQLVVSPRASHGADTTLVDFEIVEVDGEHRRWNVKDLVDDSLATNPAADKLGHQAVWCFVDKRAGLAFLSEHLTEINGRPELKVWRNGETPSVFVNTSADVVNVWTQLPAKSFFVHPGAEGPVAVMWISPIDGAVTCSGRIADVHSSGPDGVSWSLEHWASPTMAENLTALRAASEARESAKSKRDQLAGMKPIIPVAYAVADAKPINARIQKRGDPLDLGDEVPRKFLDQFGGKSLENPQSSGRKELAECLTDPANPLVARVMVNRIWQGHFGRGIVSTPNDFGTRGNPPTHPELLDYLAAEFVQDGWSMKEIHRQLMASATYQQQAGEGESLDLYGSFARRRLSAEEIRDTELALSGDLDQSRGEGHPFPPESSWKYTQHTPFALEFPTLRRSVYVMQKRSRRSPFFALFDGADPNASTPVRDNTTVPTQALYFMNDPFFHERADGLAKQIDQSSSDESKRIDFAYAEIFGRPASVNEHASGEKFLREYRESLTEGNEQEKSLKAWRALARIMLASNEALYLD